MKQRIWTIALIAALALVGCAEKAEEGPKEIPVSEGDDAYQTAVYAQQKADWEAKAEQGDARSQRQLGIMYYIGQGMEIDYAKAFEWLEKAAVQGDDVAQLTLGVMYVEGQGVPQSNVQGHMWLSLAAQQGNQSATIRLDDLAPKLDAEELAEAQKLADDWEPSL